MTPTPPSTGHTLQDTIDALTTLDLLLLIAELAAEVANRHNRQMQAHMDILERAERRAQAERDEVAAKWADLGRAGAGSVAERRAQAERDEVAAKWADLGRAGAGSVAGPVVRPVSDTNGSDPRAVDTQLGATLDGGDG